METKFNFNSQICTTREQSERLIALGLKKETADICWSTFLGKDERQRCWLLGLNGQSLDYDDEHFYRIPAWSLHRLMAMMPKKIVWGNETFKRVINPTSIGYYPQHWQKEFARFVSINENYFNCIIDCIAGLIKEGYFNKEYLV